MPKFRLFIAFFTFLSAGEFVNLPELKVGDIIFRRGTGTDSEVIRVLSDFEFSHIGAVAEISPQIQIIHATTHDDIQKTDAVVIASFDEFTQNSANLAIMRIPLDENQTELVQKRLFSLLGEKFVLSENGLYCTTLIEKAFDGIIAPNLERETLNVPFMRNSYLFPKAFWNLPNSEIIFLEHEF